MTKPAPKSAIQTAVEFVKSNWILVVIFCTIIGAAWKGIVIPQVEAIVKQATASGYHPTEESIDLKIAKAIKEEDDDVDDKVNSLWNAMNIRVPSKEK